MDLYNSSPFFALVKCHTMDWAWHRPSGLDAIDRDLMSKVERDNQTVTVKRFSKSTKNSSLLE